MIFGPALAGMLLLASPPPAHDIDAIDQTKTEAYAEEKYAFCTAPARPLGPRQRLTCNAAREIEGCKALVDACDADEVKPPPDWLTRAMMALAPFAKLLLYLLIAVIVVAIAIPVVSGLVQLRRRRRAKEEKALASNVATVMETAPPELVDASDPEEVLRLADERLARGDHRGAIVFSLAAALRALDRRGAIRVAKHRTNGEYVRSCADETARPRLREIVRTVDAIEFGGAEPTNDSAQKVTSRAREIVRAAVVVATLGLLTLGCNRPRGGTDPAGDDLPIAVLERNGYDVKPLSSSLSTMPIPDAKEGAPVVLIDMARVPIEEETEAHLMRWVEAGGVLVLFGKPESWPADLKLRAALNAETRDLRVSTPDPNGGLIDMDAEDEPMSNVGKPIEFSGARVSHQDAFSWRDGVVAEPLALLGNEVYASKRRVGTGYVLAVANDDLWTNVGIMPRRNAAALVTLVRAVSHEPRRLVPIRGGKVQIGDLRVARAEDGIPPPSNPFAALVAAGLGRGAWHALAAAILLFLAYGIRHARPKTAAAKPRRAFSEHVIATGAFYARARARTQALASYGKLIELRLREIAPRGADPAAFLASRSGASPERAAELLARAAAAKTNEIPKGDELELIAELRAMLAKALDTKSAPKV